MDPRREDLSARGWADSAGRMRRSMRTGVRDHPPRVSGKREKGWVARMVHDCFIVEGRRLSVGLCDEDIQRGEARRL